MATHAPITGAPTRAPAFQYTAAGLSRFCAKHGIAPTRFGRAAVNDPRLIGDLWNGRELSERVLERVAAFIGRIEAQTREVATCSR